VATVSAVHIANTEAGTRCQNFAECHSTGDGVEVDEVDPVAAVAAVVIEAASRLVVCCTRTATAGTEIVPACDSCTALGGDSSLAPMLLLLPPLSLTGSTEANDDVPQIGPWGT